MAASITTSFNLNRVIGLAIVETATTDQPDGIKELGGPHGLSFGLEVGLSFGLEIGLSDSTAATSRSRDLLLLNYDKMAFQLANRRYTCSSLNRNTAARV